MGNDLRHTSLYARHAGLGARLVTFGGWEMPVQYAGIVEEPGRPHGGGDL